MEITFIKILMKFIEDVKLDGDHRLDVGYTFLIAFKNTVLMANILPYFYTSYICPNEPCPILDLTVYSPIFMAKSFKYIKH